MVVKDVERDDVEFISKVNLYIYNNYRHYV